MTEAERSLLMGAIITLLERAGGEARITEADYEKAMRIDVTSRYDGKDIIFRTKARI